jgi:hypothetical protein
VKASVCIVVAAAFINHNSMTYENHTMFNPCSELSYLCRGRINVRIALLHWGYLTTLFNYLCYRALSGRMILNDRLGRMLKRAVIGSRACLERD